MDKKLIQQVGFHTVAFLIGLYVGLFFSEASTMFMCYRDSAFTVSGTFWKGDIRFECRVVAQSDQVKP